MHTATHIPLRHRDEKSERIIRCAMWMRATKKNLNSPLLWWHFFSSLSHTKMNDSVFRFVRFAFNCRVQTARRRMFGYALPVVVAAAAAATTTRPNTFVCTSACIVLCVPRRLFGFKPAVLTMVIVLYRTRILYSVSKRTARCMCVVFTCAHAIDERHRQFFACIFV